MEQETVPAGKWAQIVKWLSNSETGAVGYLVCAYITDNLAEWIESIYAHKGCYYATNMGFLLGFYFDGEQLVGVQAYYCWGREGWSKEHQWAKRGYRMRDLEKVDPMSNICMTDEEMCPDMETD